MQNFDIKRIFCARKMLVMSFFMAAFIQGQSQIYPVETIQDNGNRSNRIIFSYLSDGYQSAQLPTFITNATTINTSVFSQTPFSQYKSFFNSYAVRVPSTDAGAKHPGSASDEGTSGSQPIIDPSNYFSSTFDYASIHRLLVPTNNAGLFGVLASNVPDYDQGFIVVNSPYYGGSGGTFATGSTHTQATEVAIHEIGHSFASLADEYWAGDGYAAEKPNMTQTTNPATVKWKNWYGLNNIGIYPYGNTGTSAIWYRPHQLCKMQYLGYPFCSVCTERFIDRIHQLVNMVDSYLPASTSYNLTSTNPVVFSVANLQTEPATIKVNWYLNGNTTAFATNISTVTVPFTSFNIGSNTLRAEVVDNTTLSKSYLPTAGYINNLTWTVFKDGTLLPIKVLTFAGKLNSNKAAEINWEVEDVADLKYFELEKSKDGNNFSLLTTIQPQSRKKAYTFVDAKMYLPHTWYRLKMKEKNGAINHSNILDLSNPFDKFYYKVYQDADARKYHLSCTLSNMELVTLRIVSASGQEILKKNFGETTNGLEFDFDLKNRPAGVYFANIQIGATLHTVTLSAQ